VASKVAVNIDKAMKEKDLIDAATTRKTPAANVKGTLK
jgi:hypothetical protein